MQQILLSTDHHITVGWSVDEERPQPFKILICALWIIFTSLLFYVCFIHICPTFPSPSDIFLHHKIAFPFDGASFLTKSLVVFLPFPFFFFYHSFIREVYRIDAILSSLLIIHPHLPLRLLTSTNSIQFLEGLSEERTVARRGGGGGRSIMVSLKSYFRNYSLKQR